MEYNFSVTPRLLIIFITCCIFLVIVVFFLGFEIGEYNSQSNVSNASVNKPNAMKEFDGFLKQADSIKKSVEGSIQSGQKN
jgi:hypothetical protein